MNEKRLGEVCHLIGIIFLLFAPVMLGYLLKGLFL